MKKSELKELVKEVVKGLSGMKPTGTKFESPGSPEGTLKTKKQDSIEKTLPASKQKMVSETQALSGMKKMDTKEAPSTFKAKEQDDIEKKLPASKQKMVSEEVGKEARLSPAWRELVAGTNDDDIADLAGSARGAVKGELSKIRAKLAGASRNDELGLAGHWNRVLASGYASKDLVNAFVKYLGSPRKIKETLQSLVKEAVEEYRTKGALSASNPNRKVPVKSTGANYKAKGLVGYGRPKKQIIIKQTDGSEKITTPMPLEVYFEQSGKKTLIDFDFLNNPWPKAKNFLEAEIMAELPGEEALIGNIGEDVYNEIEKAKENDLDGKLTVNNNTIVLYYDSSVHKLRAKTEKIKEGDVNTTSTGPYNNLYGDDDCGDSDIKKEDFIDYGFPESIDPSKKVKENHYAMQHPEEFDTPQNNYKYTHGTHSPLPSNIVIDGKSVDKTSIGIEGVDPRDRPDFVDAFAATAEFKDGTPLTDAQLEELTERYPEIINDLAHDQISGA